MSTIFTDRENLAKTLRAQFIVDGMNEVDAGMINDAIRILEEEMAENGSEGAQIRSDYLDVNVTVTAHADRARETVAAGAALLDSLRDDDWRALINRDTLDIASVTDCVLGQLYGGYDDGYSTVRRIATERGIVSLGAWRNAFVGCGFSDPGLCCGSRALTASLLTLAWRELLESSPVNA